MKQFLLILTALVLSAPAISAGVRLRVLSDLDGFEPFEAHIFHAGHLWTGRSRQGLGAFYRLEVYTPDGKQTHNVELGHSVKYLIPHGPSSVVAIGVTASSENTAYTEATLSGGRLVTRQITIPVEAWGDRAIDAGGQLYFTDPGGNQNDPGLQPGVAAQTIFTLAGGRPRYLRTRLPAPFQTEFLDGNLWIVQFPQITSAVANLVKLDLATETARTVLNKRNGLKDLLLLSNPSRLALAESGAGRVLLVDPKTAQLTATLRIEAGTPRALAALGKCLVVGSEASKQVTFLDLSRTPAREVARWDLAAAGAKFHGIRKIAVDPQSGNVFVRSAYACNPLEACPANRNSVSLAEDGGVAARLCR